MVSYATHLFYCSHRLSFLAAKIDEKNRLKDAISHHRTGLPPHLLFLFQGRPTPPYLPPMRKRKPTPPITGVAAYTEHFAEPGDPEHEPPPPDTRPTEPRIFLNPEYAQQVRVDIPTKLEKLVHAKQATASRGAAAGAAEPADGWDPAQDPNLEGDPYKTLFVARLAYDVSERKLRREFEEFGPIKRINVVHDKITGKPKGYAFIEFEHKSDMKEAYKATDGMRIEERRCLVDVERGRSVPGWRPRRLGGGKGGESRAARPPKDPEKFALRQLVDRLAGVEEAAIGMDVDRERERGAEREEYGERERDSYRETSHRERERGGDRGDRKRDRRDRDEYAGGGSRRDRDRSRGGRDRGDRDRDRDYYKESRKRDRGGGYDDYDDRYGSAGGGGYGGYGGSGEYNAVPPPGYGGGTGYPAVQPAVHMGAGVDSGGYDEPEEGEYIDEREAKRLRERDTL